MENKVYIGQTGTEQEKTPIDWNAIFSGATDLAASYFGYKTSQQQGRTPAGGGTTTIVTAPSGMSQTTKALLIGGGILVAGLLVFTLTKKK